MYEKCRRPSITRMGLSIALLYFICNYMTDYGHAADELPNPLNPKLASAGTFLNELQVKEDAQATINEAVAKSRNADEAALSGDFTGAIKLQDGCIDQLVILNSTLKDATIEELIVIDKDKKVILKHAEKLNANYQSELISVLFAIKKGNIAVSKHDYRESIQSLIDASKAIARRFPESECRFAKYSIHILLGDMYFYVGEYAKSIEHYGIVRECRITHYGHVHRDLFGECHCLALAYLCLGDAATADAYCRDRHEELVPVVMKVGVG